MLPRAFAILGILLALFGFMIAPGIVTRAMRNRRLPIRRLNPNDGDIPWDLTGWIPFGILDRRGPLVKREWTWVPKFRRVK